jgi:phosphoglycerate dehydrogenase-like enzyme
MSDSKPSAAFLLAPQHVTEIYSPSARSHIAAQTILAEPVLTRETWRDHPDITARTEILLSGWGMERMDADFLKAFPALRLVLYGAGSIKGFQTAESWDRGVRICSAHSANAIPVAEFTVSQIVLSLKHTWRMMLGVRENRDFHDRGTPPGNFHTTVGLISLGAIGRLVARRLTAFDHEVIAFDPFLPAEIASEVGVTLVSLDEIFARSDVVSCHTPWLPETEKLLREDHFRRMKPGATFINTSRGAVVDEEGLCRSLADRPDLFALLDVTWPEPPAPDSPLFNLSNVLITPHIAGSMGNECQRMGMLMVEELERYLSGAPLRHEVSRTQAAHMA